jgi:hypothetical protein
MAGVTAMVAAKKASVDRGLFIGSLLLKPKNFLKSG